MTMLLLQADPTSLNWQQFGMAAAVVFVVFIFLVFVWKVLPQIGAIWERVRTAEIGVREKEADARLKEAESRIQQATGFSQLAGALTEMSGVIKEVVIEQRHATDKAILMSRVNADRSEEMISMMNELSSEIGSVKEALGEKKRGTQAKSTPTN